MESAYKVELLTLIKDTSPNQCKGDFFYINHNTKILAILLSAAFPIYLLKRSISLQPALEVGAKFCSEHIGDFVQLLRRVYVDLRVPYCKGGHTRLGWVKLLHT